MEEVLPAMQVTVKQKRGKTVTFLVTLPLSHHYAKKNQKFEEVVKYSRASNSSIKGGKGVLLQIAIIPSDQNAHRVLPASASVHGLLPSVPRDEQ